MHNLLSGYAQRLLLAAVLLAALIGSTAPARSSGPVTDEEKAAAVGVIKELYDAYTGRNLEKILALEHDFIEKLALEYEKRKGPGKGDEYRDAIRGVTEEVLNSSDFAMKPLRLDDVEYRREGEQIVVSSAIPIIASETVEVAGDGLGNKARLSMSKFWLKKTHEGWRINNMDLR